MNAYRMDRPDVSGQKSGGSTFVISQRCLPAPVRVRVTTTSGTNASLFAKPKNGAIPTGDFVRKREQEKRPQRLQSQKCLGTTNQQTSRRRRCRKL